MDSMSAYDLQIIINAYVARRNRLLRQWRIYEVWFAPARSFN